MNRTKAITEALIQAAQDMASTSDSLRVAYRHASAVEALVLLPIIGRVNEARNEMVAYLSARIADTKPNPAREGKETPMQATATAAHQYEEGQAQSNGTRYSRHETCVRCGLVHQWGGDEATGEERHTYRRPGYDRVGNLHPAKHKEPPCTAR